MRNYEFIEDYLKEKYADYDECGDNYYTVCSKVYKMKSDYEIFTPIEEAIGRVGNWGLCDKNGKVIIKPQYLFPLIPFQNYYLVSLPIINENISSKRYIDKITDVLSGLIDINNNEIIPIKYSLLDNIDKNGNMFIAGLRNDTCGIIDINNNIICPFVYENIKYVPNFIKENFESINQIEIERDGYIGVYDLNEHKEIIAPKYKYLEIIMKDVFLVSDCIHGARMNGKIIDENENEIIFW